MGRFSQLIRLTFGCRRPNAAVRLLSNFQAQCHAIGRLSPSVGAKIDHVQLEAMENTEATEKRK